MSAPPRALPPLAGTAPGWLARLDIDARVAVLAAVLVALWLVLDWLTDGLFLTPRNLSTLAVQTSVVAILSTGMVLVIVARQIDLSVGSLLGLLGMGVAALQIDGVLVEAAWPWPATVAAGIVVGALLGGIQGYWIAYRGLPAFVVTLAGLLIFRGLAYLVSEGRTLAPLAPGFDWMGGGLGGGLGGPASWGVGAIVVVGALTMQARSRADRVRHGLAPRSLLAETLRAGVVVGATLGFVALMNAYTHPRTGAPRGIPVPVVWLAVVALAVHGLARRTRFGRHVFAAGGGPDAAERAGIDLRRLKTQLFVLMGALTGLAAAIATARLGAGTSSLGTLTELSVIAAAVIGGTSLAGGVGSVFGAVIGALVMQSLESGLVLLGLSSAVRQISIGGLLLLAVWADVAATRRRART